MISRFKLLLRLQRRVTKTLGRVHISENTFMAILAVVIGLLSGLGNYAFRKLVELVHWLVVEQGMSLFDVPYEGWSPARFWTILFPVVGGLLVIPLWIYFRNDLRFGFSRFLAQVNLRGGRVPARTIFTRGAASAITLGTGGSAGQEGPIAQIGGAIGSQLGQVFNISGDRLKTIVACGVSGGVAATFNAPIAGVFFAQEIVLLSSFELSSFTSIVIASGMSTVVSRALLGNAPAFVVPPYTMSSGWELVFYVVLGLLIGALAPLFIKFHFRVKDLFTAIKLPAWGKPVLGGLLVGAIGVFLPQISGNGYEFMEQVLHGQGTWMLLAGLIVFKALATSITLGSGLPGGMFAPSLYIGAVTGGAFGCLLKFLYPSLSLSVGAYALVGMGAFLSAATHAPMTAIFLLFEITASYQVIIPIMVACVIGTTMSRHFHKESLETEELSRIGIDLGAGKERNIMKSLRVGEVMTRDPESIPEQMTLRQFTKTLAGSRQSNFPLVNEAGELTGILSSQDFMGAVFERDLMDLVVVKELATVDIITVTEDEDLDQVMRKIGLRNIEQLPVVDRDNSRKLVGIISRRDMVSAYNRALMSRSMEEKDGDDF